MGIIKYYKVVKNIVCNFILGCCITISITFSTSIGCACIDIKTNPVNLSGPMQFRNYAFTRMEKKRSVAAVVIGRTPKNLNKI